MSTAQNLRRSERLKDKGNNAHKKEDVPVNEHESRPITSTSPVPSKSRGSKSNKKSKSHVLTTSQSSKISKLSQARRHQAELETAMKKKELEQEMLEIQFKKKQELLDLELALQLAKIESDLESDDNSESSESKVGPNVEKWVRGEYPWEGQQNIPPRTLRQSKLVTNKDEVRSLFPESLAVNHQDISGKMTSSQLTKFLTRQSVPKDLPIFVGNPTEWPNFIYQYRNSTAICGYSQEENHCRLQKCLKGNARKIVQSLLIMPQNVDKIIQILETRFGQPEQIIFMLLDKIKTFPIIREDKLDCLINFSDEVKNLVGVIESLNAEDHLRNPILLRELLNKLPNSYKMMWIEHISSKTPQANKLTEFCIWLEKKATAACQLQVPKYFDDMTPTDNQNIRHKLHRKSISLATVVKKKCICCNNDMHHLTNCSTFKSFSKDEKWEFVKFNKICFSCLIPYHGVNDCRKKKLCGINNCKKHHHRLLHTEQKHNVNNEEQAISNINIDKDAEVNCHISTNKHVLLKILPVTVCYNQKSMKTYALLDDASTVSLIDQDLADALDINGPQQPLCLQWTSNQTNEQDDSRNVSFTLRAELGNKEFQLRHVRTIRGISLPTQTVDVGELSKHYPYIDNKCMSMINAKPTILIGQDNWPLLMNRKIITGPWNGPALSKTLLGWVIHGNINMESKQNQSTNLNFVCHIDSKSNDDLDLLHDLVKEQWKLECFGLEKVNKPMSKEDIRAQDILNRTMKRCGDKFETGLLWRDEKSVLPESRNNAIKRLHCTERKIDRDSTYAKAYCDKMSELLRKCYIRKLTKEEAEETSSKTWYLPHFGIRNPNKPDKLRIVFDASSKSNGKCLNDFLLTGPDLYNSLHTILLNFRIKKYAFVADIKEMFLQVRVRKEDRKAQRILWRGMDRNRDPDVYEIEVVFFGSTSGPSLAQEAKNRNALDFETEYPEASKAIVEDHYMDDYLGGADSITEGNKLIKEVIYVHSKGGFTICNWISNADELLEDVNPELRAPVKKHLGTNPKTATERILGVYWDSSEDNFLFQTKFHKISSDILENKRRPTKRDILKVVMSIFDPLGFLANFMIQGKILLQDIWRSNLGWDDEITEILKDKWDLWINDLKNIYKFKIPRQYFTLLRENTIIQLHMFCDASEKSFAAVAYLRCQEENNVQIAFVNAKARVTPLKPISIPRLELQAALMGARLGDYLKTSLKLNISNIFYWTDSKTVLHWIRAEAQRFKIFVAQRIGEIQNLTNTTDWRYVPSKENVADEATKRTQNLDFSADSRWLFGPKFLQLSPENWPQENNNLKPDATSNLEERRDFVFLNFEKLCLPIPDPEKFSKWSRLVRATGWMLRFIEKCRNHSKIDKNIFNKSPVMNLNELDSEEIKKAEIIIFRKIQQESFSEEIKCLENNHSVHKSSKLYTLSCDIGEGKLLRLKGRLDNLQGFNEDFRKPIILDPSHLITKLIIKHFHEEVQHHGKETVINNLRQKFWILRMRQAVKSVWNQCQICKNKKVMPKIPIMGQLPTCRLEPTIRPFIKTGVDYFGPILVIVKRSHEKRYGVIFTCMVTRAVHMEIANDLSANGFIHVLRQFGCRRGFPEEIYSDNGTNFKFAEKELAQALKEVNQTEITKFCAMKNIRWKFNPPSAPHMGGVWERLIQSIKKTMYELLKSRYPQEYVLRTVFAETENIINSRPLTHVSIDSEDSEALTPNHFLIGPSYAALSCAKVEEKDLNLLSRWKAAQRLTDLFWKRWTHEYLPYLVKRTKWHEESKPIQENDIVIIVDPNGPRNMWPKGRVTHLYQAKDGKVRIVDIMLANGTVLRRPVSRLCILDIHKE